MKTRRTVLSALALGLAACVMAAFTAPGPETAKAEIGKPAPNFTLKNAEGKAYSLADYKGKMVVLEWINPGCPVCRRVMTKGVVANMKKELAKLDKDLVVLGIDSTSRLDPAKTAAYLAKNKMKDMVGLLDADGTVGRMYGAKTTPHMFVIDDKGILRYEGAIDDDRPGKKGDAALNYVVNAVRQIKNGETVSPDATKSYGCSVKYARK